MMTMGLVGMNHIAYFCPDGYYVNRRNETGVWHGSGAVRWGAKGAVTAEGLKNLFQRRSFDGAETLVKYGVDQESRGGFDFTFSAPKSVSIVYAQSPLQIQMRMDAIMLDSVKKTFDVFEPVLGVTRRGKGGHLQETTDGLMFALFPHLESRENDPQLHVHGVLGNLCPRSDGTWGTIDSRVLFSPGMKKAMGAAFRCELAYQLEQELGLRCVKQNEFFELEGVPASVIEEFSQRRQAIMTELEEKGFSSAQAKAVACMETRRPKEEVSIDDLKAHWRERANACGFTAERVLELFGHERPESSNRQQALETGVAEALKRLEESHRNKYRQVDLLGAMAEYCQAKGVGLEEVQATVEKVLDQHPDIVPLAKAPGQTTFTTKEIFDRERNVLDIACGMRRSAGPTVSEATMDQFRRHPSILRLNEEQRHAFESLAVESTRLTVVSGFAGVGKTSLLQAVREVYAADDFQLFGVAPTGKAALGLQKEADIPSMTIHRALMLAASDVRQTPQPVGTPMQRKLGEHAIDERTILIVDEAGMVGGKQMEKLLTLAQDSGAKVIMVGDPHQLQPVLDTGGAFGSLASRNGGIDLKSIVRQRDQWARDAVIAIVEGRSQEGLALLQSHDCITVANNYRESMERLVADWKREGLTNPASHLVILPTNAQVDALNRDIQQARIDAGLVDKQFIRCGEEKLHLGDRVVCTRNHDALGLRNGAFGEVKAIDQIHKTVILQMDGGEEVWVPLVKYDSIRLGYGVTIHRAQGATVEHCYTLIGGPHQDREMAYVQVSRARAKTHLYTNMFEAGENLSGLAAQIKRSRYDELAHEAVQRGAFEYGS